MGPMKQAMGEDEATEIVADDEVSEGEEQASPEEQAQYEEVIRMAEQIIYSRQGDKFGIVEKLKADPDPVKAIGHTAAMIGLMIKNSVEKSGGQISDEVLLNAAQEIVADLMEVAEKMGILKNADEQVFAAAMGEAVKQFGEALMKNDMITNGQRADAQATFAEQLQRERGVKPGPPRNLAGAMAMGG